jgi:PHP family Zn ribbon phosphoesterase
MQIIADLHIHSKYSRAVSPKMDLHGIGQWASYKGIDLIATGDWTHPIWLREISNHLYETSPGIYELKKPLISQKHKVRFILSVEIASIYSQGGKGRRIHNVVLAPSISVVEKINKEFARRGTNLMADGRPITGISSKDLLEMILSIDTRCMMIPAHIWTPWFSLFGSKRVRDFLFSSCNDTINDPSVFTHIIISLLFLLRISITRIFEKRASITGNTH